MDYSRPYHRTTRSDWSSWLKKINDYKEAYVSGWMINKGQLRQRNMNGFVLSDHADWNELNDLVTSVNQRSLDCTWLHKYICKISQ